MKLSVVVLGDLGMLGRCVAAAFGERGVPVEGWNRAHFDATDPHALVDRLKSLSEGVVVVNCVGAFPSEGLPAEVVLAVNGAFPRRVAAALPGGVSLIHIGTDGVFAGARGGYSEEDHPDAEDLYGLSKFLGEPAGAMVLRTSIVGWDLRCRRHLLEWLASRRGQEVVGFSNQVWNGLTAPELARCLVRIVTEEQVEPGVFHLFSDAPVSKLELLRRLNGILGLGVSIREGVASRPVDRSLRTVHSLQARLEIPSLDRQIEALKISPEILG